MDKDNNIVDFNAKKEKKFLNEIISGSDEVADMIIETCFANGQKDYDLAVSLLTDVKEVAEHEALRSTLLSMCIEHIAKKGHAEEAEELRKHLKNRLDERYENMVHKEVNSGIKKIDEKEIYTDVYGLYSSYTQEERDQRKELMQNLIDDKIDFSEMTNTEAYKLMKEIAKFAFYMGEPFMKKLILDDKKETIEITFQNGYPVMYYSRVALAHMMVLFTDFTTYNDAKGKNVTMHFGFME